MDYQNRVGSKKGAGGIAGSAETNRYRRERLKNLLQSKINIDADPYVLKNHLGVLECKLCLTTHMSESSYLTHTTGRRHQLNLMRRADYEKNRNQQGSDKNGKEVIQKRYWKKIGKPEYTYKKIRDPISLSKGLLFVFKLDSIKEGIKPMYKLQPSHLPESDQNDESHQYLILSAEPYTNLAFKIPGDSIDQTRDHLWDYWDQDNKEYCVQFFFKNK
ncbi:hypothetical protein CANINC_000006 [Pichia inconspicua]|uniref:U1-type domain-containing protein n=1 Tax=Pichia inconspicua TaxID=52247 RepID=A0A4T0X8K8_9ASCO|nr:hypothetical protein CANINC_000006 [[Candida] inconspicua]